MAKTTTTKAIKTQVMTPVTPPEMESLQATFKVTDGVDEPKIIQMDSMPGMRLVFDHVYFHKLADEFVAMLKPQNQKAYWLAYGEWESRNRESNIALHSIGVDPLTKILDRPRGRNNPLVRDGENIQKKLPGYYVTWKVQGGEGDLAGALEAGFRIIRHPKDKEEEKAKTPLDWNGEVWKIRDGTSDPSSGEEIFNVMVAIRQQIWDDNLKAMSMASHNAYAQNKKQFFEGSENVSRDMLGGKEKVIVQDLEESHVEEHYVGGKKL